MSKSLNKLKKINLPDIKQSIKSNFSKRKKFTVTFKFILFLQVLAYVSYGLSANSISNKVLYFTSFLIPVVLSYGIDIIYPFLANTVGHSKSIIEEESKKIKFLNFFFLLCCSASIGTAVYEELKPTKDLLFITSGITFILTIIVFLVVFLILFILNLSSTKDTDK